MGAPSPDVDHPLPGSLAALEGLDVPKGAYGAPRVARLSRALRVPVDALAPSELRFLLHEGRGVAHLMPRVLERLGPDPLLAVDGRPGDLLQAAIMAAADHWDSAPPWRDALAHVLVDARERVAALGVDAPRALADEIDLACDRFLAS